MSFEIDIKVDPGQAVPAIAKVEAALGRVEKEGPRAGAAISRGMRDSAVASERAARANSALAQSFGGVATAIQREQAMLERIQGPMRRYEQDMQTLESLHRRGAVTASQYADELARIRKSAGVANPASAVSLPAPAKGGVSGAFGSLGSVAGKAGAIGAAVAGGVYAAKQVLDLSDAYIGLENRLRQVAGSQAELNHLMDATKGIADRTRSDWATTTEAYVRLINATKELGLSQERGLAITETLNMALQSSGASASEASAGTLQLMQGLAAGALQGDEFRSIAEQLPGLLDIFAKEMGVSRGELKKLGSEGKITTDIVIRGLENASGAIRNQFSESTATAGQLWSVLKNQLTESAGELVRSTGLMEILGVAGRFLVIALDALTTSLNVVLWPFKTLIGVLADVAHALMNVMSSVADFVDSTVTSAITAVEEFQRSVWDGAKSLLGFGDSAESGVTLADAWAKAIHDARNPVVTLTGAVGDLTRGMSNLWDGMNRFLVGDAWGDSGLGKLLGPALKDMREKLDADAAMLKSIQGPREEYHRKVDSLNRLLEAGTISQGQFNAALEAMEGKATKAAHATKALSDEMRTIKALLDNVGNIEVFKPGSQANEFKRYEALRAYDMEVAAKESALEAAAREAGAPDLASDLAAYDARNAPAVQHVTDLKAALDKIRGPAEEYRKQLGLIDELLATGRITTGEYATALGALNEQFDKVSDFDSALKELNDGALAQLHDSVISLGDAFVDAFTQAEFSWRKFFDAMAADLAKGAIRGFLQLGIAAISGGGAAGIPAAASGADFTVGGVGGTDSQLAMLRVTPGEHVSVRTPHQQMAEARDSSERRGPARPLNVYVDRGGQVTHGDLEDLVVRVIDRNAPAIRSRLTGR